ncbi:hypothetical protein L1987_35586 [Smallanthus sonchifolius]|uniref:Uncharacterized protein n=1 Tax=Smallanthus sonchifolius TaxID=185202 RepID=A0ACB9HB10_9ASTR|nr:hypothetical protein L1987_35586 [Smallanthus sonchifolius]
MVCSPTSSPNDSTSIKDHVHVSQLFGSILYSSSFSDLNHTIFVRVYESRMDLLRAVIVGPAGTPYHDGLFVFDVHFPPTYPDTPPVCQRRLYKLINNATVLAYGQATHTPWVLAANMGPRQALFLKL